LDLFNNSYIIFL